MAFSNKLIFVFALLLSISAISHSADLISKECGKNSTSTDVVQGNINTVILDLVTKTTANGFANSSFGSGGDTVYGIAECRGDISGQDCSSCIIDAGQELRTTCANTTESSIWYHQCSLRYSTTNFIGQPDTNLLGVWVSAGNMTDPHAFKQTLKELLSVLLVAAPSGESRKFSWGQIESPDLNNTATITIYEMAHCSWDLQEISCLTCLGASYQILQSECGELAGCYIILKSCAIRYEVSPFLFVNGASDPAVTARKIAFNNL